MKLTDQQLDTKVEEYDLPEVSACFDFTRLQLTYQIFFQKLRKGENLY